MSKRPPKCLPPALAAIAAVEPFNPHQLHLGNLAAVEEILRGLLDLDEENCASAAAGTPWEVATSRTVQRVQALSEAFLGRDTAYIAVPGWNEPGAIDAHLRRHVPNLEGPAEKVIADLLARVIIVGRQLMDETDEDTIAATLTMSVKGTARLLVGLRPA